MKAEISLPQADNIEELIEGLRQIYFYYQYRQDTYVPPQYNVLRLNEMTLIDHEVEDFREQATALLRPIQLREILNRKEEFEKQLFAVNLKLEDIPNLKLAEKNAVVDEYQKSIEKIMTEARLKGSGYSNSLNNEVALLEAKRSEKLLEVESKYVDLESELLAKKTYYQEKIDGAESYFYTAHKADVEKKMLELYNEYQNKKDDVFKYNNTLTEKIVKYNNSLTQAIEKTRLDFMEIKQKELTNEQLLQTGYFVDAVEWVLKYYYEEYDNNVDAYEDFILHEEFTVYLKSVYDNLLDLLYVRAYGSSVSIG
jgi:hypothetical protein